jgi:Prephenate dehydratase
MGLDKWREEIDKIDTTMVELFSKRMRVAAKIAVAKKEKNLPVFDQQRESKVMTKVVDMAEEEFAMYIKMLYSTIFDLSKNYQAKLLDRSTRLTEALETALQEPKTDFSKKTVVACQGVEGSYASQAAEKLFPLGNMMHFESFESVFHAVEQGLCKYGVLPVENSSTGSVTEVYELMNRNQFYIARTLRLHIHHVLLTKAEVDTPTITEIVSHEQALGQCSEFLKQYPKAKLTVFENTASAAKYVAESDREDIAAISSVKCAKLYGLHVAKRNIQNNENNYTRFICISKNLEIPEGANRISLMLSVSHRPGALHDMLGKIVSMGLNLSKLESRPIPGKDFEFRFYFDIDGSVYQKDVQVLLADMQLSAEEFTFLGCYVEG